jgi:hypothetical protein
MSRKAQRKMLIHCRFLTRLVRSERLQPTPDGFEGSHFSASAASRSDGWGRGLGAPARPSNESAHRLSDAKKHFSEFQLYVYFFQLLATDEHSIQILLAWFILISYWLPPNSLSCVEPSSRCQPRPLPPSNRLVRNLMVRASSAQGPAILSDTRRGPETAQGYQNRC